MTFCRTLALSAAAGAFLLGGTAFAAGITVHDARNRDVTITDAARIVSIGGAITEILYALGFEDRLAGVDSTALSAAALRDKAMSATCASFRRGRARDQSLAGMAAQGSGTKNHGRLEASTVRWCGAEHFRKRPARQISWSARRARQARRCRTRR